MTVLICPGIHDLTLTQQFLGALERELELAALDLRSPWLVFPAHQFPAYSAPHILYFLAQQPPLPEGLTLVGFSAGVVGAIATAWLWQGWGGQVRALMALDGWGVPLYGSFPSHRLSHDRFTHWSSMLLGGDQGDSFYADPGVEHLDLWRSPHQIQGWHFTCGEPTLTQGVPSNAAQFLVTLLQRYGETVNSNFGTGDLEW